MYSVSSRMGGSPEHFYHYITPVPVSNMPLAQQELHQHHRQLVYRPFDHADDNLWAPIIRMMLGKAKMDWHLTVVNASIVASRKRTHLGRERITEVTITLSDLMPGSPARARIVMVRDSTNRFGRGGTTFICAISTYIPTTGDDQIYDSATIHVNRSHRIEDMSKKLGKTHPFILFRKRERIRLVASRAPVAGGSVAARTAPVFRPGELRVARIRTAIAAHEERENARIRDLAARQLDRHTAITARRVYVRQQHALQRRAMALIARDLDRARPANRRTSSNGGGTSPDKPQ